MLCGSLAAVWLVVASGMKVPDRSVRAGVQTAAT
jgi:hypothetical protein